VRAMARRGLRNSGNGLASLGSSFFLSRRDSIDSFDDVESSAPMSPRPPEASVSHPSIPHSTRHSSTRTSRQPLQARGGHQPPPGLPRVHVAGAAGLRRSGPAGHTRATHTQECQLEARDTLIISARCSLFLCCGVSLGRASEELPGRRRDTCLGSPARVTVAG